MLPLLHDIAFVWRRLSVGLALQVYCSTLSLGEACTGQCARVKSSVDWLPPGLVS
jgi:hypothetical protein